MSMRPDYKPKDLDYSKLTANEVIAQELIFLRQGQESIEHGLNILSTTMHLILDHLSKAEKERKS